MVIEEAEKAFSPTVDLTMRRSVETHETADRGLGGERYGVAMAAPLFMAALRAKVLPAWGTNPVARDAMLRMFLPQESIAVSAIGSVVSKYASFTWSIDGPPRTSKKAHEMAHESQDGEGWQAFISLLAMDLLCLAGTSKVALGGDRLGQVRNIRDIVRERDPGPVLTIGPTGEIEERPINQWHRSPLGDRHWVWIHAEHVGGHTGSQPGGLFMTNDHPLLTRDGWMEAGDIRPGMQIASGHASPNTRQAQMLAGTLLGDGCLAWNDSQRRSRAILRMTQNGEQRDWLRLKRDALKGFRWTPEQNSGNSLSQNSHSSAGLRELRERWYPDGKKIVARDVVEQNFSPLMLATWYGDDGSIGRVKNRDGSPARPNARLYTNGFTVDDARWLADLLTRHGYRAHTVPMKWKTGAGEAIFIHADGTEKLFREIGRYMPPSLRHKLPPSAEPFDPEAWELGAANPEFVEVLEARPRSYMHGNREAKTTYHIGVEETRNFVAGGLVVHNTQDRGAFVEAIRAGKAPDAAVIGFKCLDAASCHLTDDPRNPVLYHDRVSGKQTLMPWWSVYHLRQLPWHHPIYRGLQLSSLTRFYAYALVWKNITQIHAEKTGGRFSRAIHIIGGVTRPWLEDAMADQSKRADEAGQIAFQLPTLMTTVDPTATASVATIDLVALPDGFEKAEEFKEYVTVLAMALETDVQELAPLPSGQMGSAMQSQTLDQKSKAKGAANFRKLITHMMNHFLLPSNCEFAYDEQDIEEEGKEAENGYKRAQTRALQVQSQELDAAGARQQALDDGDISEELFKLMNERDLTYGALGEDQQIAQIDDTQSADAFALGLAMPGVPQTSDIAGMGQFGQTPTAIRRRPPIFGGKGIPEARATAEDEVAKMLMSSMAASFREFRKAIEAD